MTPHIYIDDNLLRPSAEELERWTASLPPQRREQVLSVRHDQGRRERLLVYRLLCRALREEYGITEQPVFQYNEHGKPFLASGSPFFSLSHCREAVACAVGNHPIGIDIESIRTAKDSLVRYTMNEAEQEHIFSSYDPDRSFTRLWTQKEAVAKLLGTGVLDNIKEMLTIHPYILRTEETERYIWSVAE